MSENSAASCVALVEFYFRNSLGGSGVTARVRHRHVVPRPSRIEAGTTPYVGASKLFPKISGTTFSDTPRVFSQKTVRKLSAGPSRGFHRRYHILQGAKTVSTDDILLL